MIYICAQITSMDLSEILTISGKPGLYKIVAQSPG
ncbi:MAG: DUF5606 domain-containing protein, partial [Flavobacteriales bacterium]|nr:DUF5606 domain-containing protein [Flavobacteriales bacterium]